jgi:hypothetical protein
VKFVVLIPSGDISPDDVACLIHEPHAVLYCTTQRIVRESRKIAVRMAAIAVALGAMTSVAWSESMKLIDAQMDQVVAGVSLVRVPLNPYKYATGAHHPGGQDQKR